MSLSNANPNIVKVDMSKSAIVIDLRNNSPDPLCEEVIINNLNKFLDISRVNGTSIIWIKTVADNQYCKENMTSITKLIKASDHIIEQYTYSTLLDILKKNNINDVYICGVISKSVANEINKYCASLSIIDDCSTSVNPSGFGQELNDNTLLKTCRTVTSSIMAKKRNMIYGIGSGDSMLIYNILPPDLNKDSFEKLKGEIGFHDMYHLGGKVPRLVSLQGTIDEINNCVPIYRHPVDQHPTLNKWTPFVDIVRTFISNFMSQDINHGLLQEYRNGHDWISEHSDKTLDIVHDTNILNHSSGAERTMILKYKEKNENEQVHKSERYNLPNNSLFVLGPKTNRETYHSIRQDKRLESEKTVEEKAFDGVRISGTYRTIGTFMRLSDNRLYGQGNKIKTLKELDTSQFNELSDKEIENQSIEMLKSFSKENHDPSFDWNTHYAKGFDIISIKVNPYGIIAVHVPTPLKL